MKKDKLINKKILKFGMNESKVIQTCQKIANEYGKEMNKVFTKFRSENVRSKIHNKF